MVETLGADGGARHLDRSRPSCRGFPANSRKIWRGSKPRSSSSPARPSTSARPKQLGDILFGKMGLPGAQKTATGAWSTAAGVLEDLAEEGNRIRRAHSRMAPARRSSSRPIPTRCRTTSIRTRIASTRPMRWPRRRPAGFRHRSPILQNIPIRTEVGRKIRRAFIATPGHKLVSADYSQIELRLLAHIADIPQLRQAFADGHDIHAMTASEMFGVAGRRHAARSAPPRQGDQFRHHLRHLRVRARQSARHSARRGGRLHQKIFRALSRHPRLYGRDEADRARAAAT